MKKRIYSVKSAAEAVGMSLRHFHRAAIEEGGVPVFAIGRTHFMLASDLERWKNTPRRRKATAKRGVYPRWRTA